MLSSVSIGPLKVVALSRPQACRHCLRHLIRPSLVRLHSDFTPINPSTTPKRKTSSLTSDDAVPNPYQVTPRLRNAVVSVLKAAPRSVDNTAPMPTILSLHSSRATPIYPTKNGSSSSRSMSTQSTTGPTEETAVATEQTSENLDDVLPHRRRALRKKLSAAGPDGTSTVVIPPDASSLLTTSSAAASSSLKRSMLAFLSLSKPRLTALIVLTTMTSYALFPVDPLLASPAAPTLSALTLVYLTAGTALSSASANALNMAFEPAFDAQMSRTKNRPLVRGLLSKPQAIGFAALAGSLGVAALHIGVNPTVAALGALNIFLYAGVYTPMKRISITNTWIGAIVGGIPPLMGWAAAAGSTATEGTALELLSHPGGWLLASLLFAWQFPHFNALSWTIREEYKAAGYRMMAWVNPALNGRVALRYSVLFFPICLGLWWYGVTDPGFVVTSSVVNAWLTREAWRFYKYGGEKGRARGLFWASVWHLPLLLVLAMAHKEGIWRGVYEKFWVKPVEDEGEWEDEEEDEEEHEEQGAPWTAATHAVQVVPIKR